MTSVSPVRPRPSRALAPPKSDPLERVFVRGKYFQQGLEKLHVKGVTYGPFAPNARGVQFPATDVVRFDFKHMRQAGFNAIRTYIVPPSWLFDVAAEHGLSLFVDIPWRKHVCFLDSATARREAREAMRRAGQVGAEHVNCMAYSIGNEIPTEIVRWYGPRRIERFLAELQDELKQIAPEAAVTYASYPPTEYLDLSFLDFVTFNVYLHDHEAFRRYMFRLQNSVGDKPLVLGELGMDTIRHGDEAQANFLAGHIAELRLMGLAGSFVFSWTDDWHTGGAHISDWAFGITRRDRSAKDSLDALRLVHDSASPELLAATPRVSIVVCTYNGGRTLRQCLESLEDLDYPDYEVIVVDDGSTDGTRNILSDFPQVRVIHQENLGLSVARNVGLRSATGAIVAYTDSDCFADRDWLSHLVHQLERTDAVAVGGPNLTPDDGQLAACVAACPGQPTHVLESDQQAEHIPGCNMAFRREALEQINGFDPQFRKAGDDVDICWRLQQAGEWITFAPGAVVWHHRRQDPKAYLKQQAGYGEAEALLLFKHPGRFNRRGESKWRGVMYGMSLSGIRFGRPLIYQGTFGSGLFQCLYQPASAHWAMVPATLEWNAAAAVIGIAGLALPFLWAVAAAMFALSLVVAVLSASQARIARQHDGFRTRLLVVVLSYVQPLVRSYYRYRTRFCYFQSAASAPWLTDQPASRFSFNGRQKSAFWSESGTGRLELLNRALEILTRHRWGRVVDSGWTPWDLRVYCDPLVYLQVRTTEENHGGNKRLIRVHQSIRPRDLSLLTLAAAVSSLVAFSCYEPVNGGILSLVAGVVVLVLWVRCTRLAAKTAALFEHVANDLGLIRCEPAEE